MIATLGRSENSPYFGVADLRSYDVWGAVRSGSTTGDPKQRYCANLGHVQDDESGLIYMRARYYEPWSGRFVSEDPARHSGNWFAYCNSNPISLIDYGGKTPDDDSFDPVYSFNFAKWWQSYWLNILTLPLRLGIGFRIGGPRGIATAAGLFLAMVVYQGIAVVELWTLRIAAWYLWLFEDLPYGLSIEPTVGDLPIIGFYTKETTWQP
ncbi:MAG: RHS repeat-associated core domain-containing protein [Armatimonadetes bacterium]|nr:RHS repeat-associated core domain-containing protein [Armatimonadota bacterium]NOG38785.1 RHS repeat-associated core domain-containing protein [Armatimonadota bacterium]GIK32695.1 MAG: hypothetical protein BroJett009_16870 [Armatimonadota bacterium]